MTKYTKNFRRETVDRWIEQKDKGYGWKVGAYEPTSCIHSDVEYIYVVNLETKRIEYINGYDFTTDDVNKLVESSYNSGKVSVQP